MAGTTPPSATSPAPAATAAAPTSTSSTAVVSRRRWCDPIATPAPRTRRSVARYRARHRLASHVSARARARSAGPGRRDATTKIGAASPMTTTNDDDDDDGSSGGGGEEALGISDGRNALNTDPAVSFSSSSSPPAKDGQLTPVYFFRSRHARIYFHSNPTLMSRSDSALLKIVARHAFLFVNNRLRSLILHATFIEKYRAAC